MESINVWDLPEPVAQAVAGLVASLRHQLTAQATTEKRGPVPLSIWDGTVLGTLSREAIYDGLV